jgi:hypothetical protein
MRDDSLTASVQYGDFDGTVAGDHHDQRHLSDLAQKYGIDTERYFVIGLNVHIGETRGDILGHTFVSILAVDTQVTKAASVDFIQQYVDEHEGVLPYVSFNIKASLDEVLLYFKRFNIVVKNSRINRVKEYKTEYE